MDTYNYFIIYAFNITKYYNLITANSNPNIILSISVLNATVGENVDISVYIHDNDISETFTISSTIPINSTFINNTFSWSPVNLDIQNIS